MLMLVGTVKERCVTLEHCPNLITLFDVQDGRYKSVNLDTVTHLSCGNKIVWEEK